MSKTRRHGLTKKLDTCKTLLNNRYTNILQVVCSLDLCDLFMSLNTFFVCTIRTVDLRGPTRRRIDISD